jgi:hypothetical protein
MEHSLWLSRETSFKHKFAFFTAMHQETKAIDGVSHRTFVRARPSGYCAMFAFAQTAALAAAIINGKPFARH